MIAAETAAAAAPDLGGVGADDELVVAPGQAVRLTAPEPGGRMEATLDGGVVRPVDGAVVAPLSGEHWLAAVFRDRAGNPSPVRWVRLRVDDRPPTLELLTEPPWAEVEGRAWVAAGARAVARASDDLAGVASTRVECGDAVVEETGGEVACALPAAGAAGAPLRLAAGAVDRVGNRAEPRSRELLLDPLPPRVTVTAEGPTARSEVGLVLGAAARLVVGGEDGESGLAAWTHTLDGHEVAGYDDLSWGPHRAEPVAVDRAGNRSAAAPFHFFYDDRPPLVEAELGAAGRAEVDGVLYLRPPVEIRVTARDVPAGLATLGWAPPGGPWRDLGAAAVASGAGLELTEIDAVGVRTGVRASLRFADTSLASGAELRLGAADRLGNAARITLQGGWRLDDAPPRIEVPRAAVAAGQALTVEVSDAGSGVAAARWRVDGGPWRDLDGPPVPVPAGDPPGERKLEVTAEDRVGNRTAGAWTVRVGGEAGR